MPTLRTLMTSPNRAVLISPHLAPPRVTLWERCIKWKQSASLQTDTQPSPTSTTCSAPNLSKVHLGMKQQFLNIDSFFCPFSVKCYVKLQSTRNLFKILINTIKTRVHVHKKWLKRTTFCLSPQVRVQPLHQQVWVLHLHRQLCWAVIATPL